MILTPIFKNTLKILKQNKLGNRPQLKRGEKIRRQFLNFKTKAFTPR